MFVSTPLTLSPAADVWVLEVDQYPTGVWELPGNQDNTAL